MIENMDHINLVTFIALKNIIIDLECGMFVEHTNDYVSTAFLAYTRNFKSKIFEQ